MLLFVLIYLSSIAKQVTVPMQITFKSVPVTNQYWNYESRMSCSMKQW